MVDEHVIAIVRLLGLDHLHMVSSIKLDHALITTFVEQWCLETHSFHLPHGDDDHTARCESYNGDAHRG